MDTPGGIHVLFIAGFGPIVLMTRQAKNSTSRP